MSSAPIRPTVLVVDDEELIRDLLEETLRDAGYDVITAATGAEALAHLESHEGFVSLVTDVNLGASQTGWDVARRAREISPTIAVIYMTGDSAHEWSAHGVPQSTVIAKPFATFQIAVAIANILNTTDERGA